MNVKHRLRFLTIGVAAVAVLAPAGCSAYRPTDPGQIGAASVAPPEPPVVASVDRVFAQRPAFGITIPDPTEERVAELSALITCRPTIVQRFASVATAISLRTLQATPGLPMLSIEPWDNEKGGRTQPDFTLKATIDGRWDEQYLKIAQAVIGYRKEVLIRFAHEMNGDWYPWAMTNGNNTADFVAAWKHVVDLFRKAGATNALWVWSPNIIRGANSTRIDQFWPGGDYVDIVGLTGYGVREKSPEITYRPTLKLIDNLTDKPVLLTEVGAQPDATKTQWIGKFGKWLKDNPRVWGFVWYETVREGDWRFSDSNANIKAFTSSLKTANVPCAG